MSKFYEYDQTNSGGSFDVDNKLCHRVYIEADDIEEANNIAEELGIYFNGCEKGLDCDCCGDRWHEPYEHMEFPIKWNEDTNFSDIEQYVSYVSNNYRATEPDSRIYYKNKTVKEF